MLMTMSNILNMEFVQALNPLYALPIVAVILCAFIVYAFGFKSPVQPPSFDGIEEEKKISKKRRTKETNKAKVVQNGKLNGNSSNKTQVLHATKKKDVEKSLSDNKPSVEKSANEKKVLKKSKLHEKKVSQEKKKESFSQEDVGEDGWVQLISKKGRKSRKKEETEASENHSVNVKPVKSSQTVKLDEIISSEESPMADDIGNSILEKKVVSKEDEDEALLSLENSKNKVTDEDSKTDGAGLEKTSLKESVQECGKANNETHNKSKKKKKKSPEALNSANDSVTSLSESSAEQMITELSNPQNSIKSSITADASETLIGKKEESQLKESKSSNVVFDELAGKKEESQLKESKSSNVVFDELAGLYPEPRELKRKKRVRRDH